MVASGTPPLLDAELPLPELLDPELPPDLPLPSPEPESLAEPDPELLAVVASLPLLEPERLPGPDTPPDDEAVAPLGPRVGVCAACDRAAASASDGSECRDNGCDETVACPQASDLGTVGAAGHLPTVDEEAPRALRVVAWATCPRPTLSVETPSESPFVLGATTFTCTGTAIR